MSAKQERPAAGGSAERGAENAHAVEPPNNTKFGLRRKGLTACVLPDGDPITVRGRDAETLKLLIRQGALGFTSGEASPLGWARRTSHYIFKLRRAGFPIMTVREKAGDACVGRYSLNAPIEVISETD